MSELERLLVVIDASTEKLRREMAKAEQTMGKTERAINKNSSAINNSFSGINKAAKGMALTMAAGFSIKAFIDAGKEMQNLEARLKTVTGSSTAANQAMAFLSTTANEQSVDILSLADGFNRLLPSVKSGRLSFEEMSKILTLTNDNVKAFGLSTSEAEGLFLGLSQTFGSGVVQMEDLRQVTDRLPGSLDTLAAAMNTDVAGLKALVAEGNLTAEMLKGPLMEAFGVNAGAAQDLSSTFDSSMTRMQNAFNEFADVIADLGLFDLLGGAVDQVSNAINVLCAVVGKFRVLYSGAFGSDDEFAEATRKYNEALKKLGPSQKAATDALEALEGTTTKNTVATQKLTKEQEKAQKKAAQLAEKKREYNEELNREIGQLEQLRAANDNSARAHDLLKAEIEAENEAREKGYRLGTKEFEQSKQLILYRERLKGSIEQTTEAREEELKKAQQQEEEMARALMAPWENAFENVQDELADMLAAGEYNFEALASIAKRLAAEVTAAWVIRPVLGEIVGATGFGGLSLTGNGAVSNSASGLGLSDLSSLSSLAGGLPSISNLLAGNIGGFSALNRLGAEYLGTGLVGQGSVTGVSLSGVGLNAGIGGLAANLMGLSSGNMAIDSIAGLAGSYGGSALASLSGLGAYAGPAGIVGALALSALGGSLFGKSRPHPAATAGIEAFAANGAFDGSSIQAKHLSEETAQQIADAIQQISTGIASAAGVDLSVLNPSAKGATAFQAGVNDGQGFFTFGDHKNRVDLNDSSLSVLFDPDDKDSLASALSKLPELFLRRVQQMSGEIDATLMQVLDNIETEGRSIDEIMSDIAFASGFEALGELPEVFTEMEAAVKLLKAEYDAAAATAERLGLSVDKVRQAEEKRMQMMLGEYMRGIAGTLLNTLAPGELARIQEEARYNSQLRDLVALGANQAELNQAELLHQLNMQALLNQNADAQNDLLNLEQQRLQVASDLANRFGRVTTSMRSFLDELAYGRFTANTPTANLGTMRDMVQALAKDASLGNIEAAEKLSELLPAFLELSGEVNGYNADYAADRDLAEQVAEHTLSTADRQVELQQRIATAAERQVTAIQSGMTALEAAMQSLGITLADIVAAASNDNDPLHGLSNDEKKATLLGRQMGLLSSNETATNGVLAQRLNQSGRTQEYLNLWNTRGYANGGFVSGTAGIDKIPSMLSNEEFVTRSAAVRSIGRGNMEYMNRTGRVPQDEAMAKMIGGVISAVNSLGDTIANSGNLNADKQDQMLQKLDRIVKDGRLAKYAS